MPSHCSGESAYVLRATGCASVPTDAVAAAKGGGVPGIVAAAGGSLYAGPSPAPVGAVTPQSWQ